MFTGFNLLIGRIGEGLGSQIMKEDRTEAERSKQFHMSLLSGGQMLSSLGPLALHGPLLRAAPLLQWSAEQMALSRTAAAAVANNNNNSTPRSKIAEDEPPSPPTQLNGAKTNTGVAPNNRERQFVCRICNHSFGYKHVLQNHERTHTGEAPFECPHCHKRFKRDHHLKTHIRLHTGEKPYHCPPLRPKFLHTGERPYACQLCSSKFSDSNQLKAHTLIHKGEKPFQCGSCQTRFRRRHHLVHHKCHLDDDDTISTTTPTEAVATTPIQIANSTPAKKRNIQVTIKEVIGGKTSPFIHRQMASENESIRRPYIASSPLLHHTGLITAALPEQTEPEDLSMSTGIKNNNYKRNINNNSSSGASGASETSEGEVDEFSDPWEEENTS
ncbi:unnamed protein product [Nesidiocoris tenuis]|uniref:C2H2-type domain-containing protein n=1 Tax=Nesidiocoris tenuis TaxID=355587 RepID=A0A6H5H733_9HEMI|nr:unnamed protein product [Nesidiocoris tenuis]